jgi:hypothetical protein
MSRQELRDLVSDMGWAALDLAQHLSFTNEMLREEYRGEAYKKAQTMAYALANMPYSETQPRDPLGHVAVFGKDGLTVHGASDVLRDGLPE